MDTLPDPLVALFFSADKRDFDSGIVTLQKLAGRSDPIELATLCVRLLSVIDGARDLSARTRSQRAGVVLGVVPPRADAYCMALVAMAWQWQSAVRNEVLRALPAEFRHRSGTTLALSRGEAASTANSSTAALERAVSVPPTVQAVEIAEVQSNRYDGAAVILLGSEEDHETNRTFLQSHDLTPLRAASNDHLAPLLERDVCAIVVAASWWAAHPASEHELLFRTLIAYSSFIWFKIDVTGLSFPVRVAKDIIRDVRLGNPDTFDFVLGDTARISAIELDSVRDVQSLLSMINSVRVVNSEIDDAQTMLLVAATTKCVRERSLRGHHVLKRVRARFIAGGRTGAHLTLVEPDDGGVPIIVKIGPATDIADEARRFKRFIAPHDSRLKPTIHRHFEWAAIVFGLVEDVSVGRPAPTLEQQLHNAMATEVHGDASGYSVDEANLALLIDRVINKLMRLNVIPCRDSGFHSFATLSLRSVVNMRANGVIWTFSMTPGDTPIALDTVVETIAAIAGRLDGCATVHGDIHLRNILCGGMDSHLIDYACSGPGHPCFDLARLEAALMFQGIRMVGDERSLAAIIAALSIDGCSFVEIQRLYPAWSAPIGNRLAFKACVLVRGAALKVLMQYGGTLEDYLAVKAVLACQSLGLIDLQAGVVIHFTVP